MRLRLANVSKGFRTAGGDHLWAVRDVSLGIDEGEVLTVVGPSGCGKSTLLNCIGGLMSYDEGSIEVGGREVAGPGPDRAIVFQQASLLPWRTAARNVAYGMELQRSVPRVEIERRVRRALELAGLEAFADYHPAQLSGGMRQRVNLARALATEPDILLMDEPFGALDALTKERMQAQLMSIVSRTGQTVLFITHDINEAVYLGDRVAVMGTRPGRVVELLDVPFPRPRGLAVHEEPPFQSLRRHIRGLLDLDEEAAGAAA